MRARWWQTHTWSRTCGGSKRRSGYCLSSRLPWRPVRSTISPPWNTRTRSALTICSSKSCRNSRRCRRSGWRCGSTATRTAESMRTASRTAPAANKTRAAAPLVLCASTICTPQRPLRLTSDYRTLTLISDTASGREGAQAVWRGRLPARSPPPCHV